LEAVINSGVAKVLPAGRMRPSKDFLRPLCQILVASLSYLWPIYVRKRPKIDINYVKKNSKLGKKKNFCGPQYNQYLNAIWPIDKKVLPPLCYILDNISTTGISKQRLWIRSDLLKRKIWIWIIHYLKVKMRRFQLETIVHKTKNSYQTILYCEKWYFKMLFLNLKVFLACQLGKKLSVKAQSTL